MTKEWVGTRLLPELLYSMYGDGAGHTTMAVLWMPAAAIGHEWMLLLHRLMGICHVLGTLPTP